MQMLLEAHIGPYLHGDLLLEQACDLAGITIHGERPVLSEEKRRAAAEEANILDWSGATTYWLRDLKVTKDGGTAFVETIRQSLPDCVLLEILWERTETGRMHRRCRLQKDLSHSRGIMLGFGPDRGRLGALLASDHVSLSDIAATFAHNLRFDFSWNSPKLNVLWPKFVEQLGRDIEIASTELDGRLWIEFATDDANAKAFVEKIIAAADACFSNKVELVDLAKLEVESAVENYFWHSIDLRQWSGGRPERYLGWSTGKAGDVVRYFGLRPALPDISRP